MVGFQRSEGLLVEVWLEPGLPPSAPQSCRIFKYHHPSVTAYLRMVLSHRQMDTLGREPFGYTWLRMINLFLARIWEPWQKLLGPHWDPTGTSVLGYRTAYFIIRRYFKTFQHSASCNNLILRIVFKDEPIFMSLAFNIKVYLLRTLKNLALSLWNLSNTTNCNIAELRE